MRILFLDIETAPEVQHFKDLSEDGQAAYTKRIKSRIGVGPDQFLNVDAAYSEAALYAEFSKIICIGIGFVIIDPTDNLVIHQKGLIGTEAEILTAFKAELDRYRPDTLCAHNGKNFDYPFIVRRLIINRMSIPLILNIEGKKPWEIVLLDTVEMWKFTDLRYYVSLITLAYVFKLPSPKDGMDGSQVPEAFYAGKIEAIKTYCLKDVYTLINVFRSMRCMTIVEKVVYI